MKILNHCYLVSSTFMNIYEKSSERELERKKEFILKLLQCLLWNLSTIILCNHIFEIAWPLVENMAWGYFWFCFIWIIINEIWILIRRWFSMFDLFLLTLIRYMLFIQLKLVDKLIDVIQLYLSKCIDIDFHTLAF